MNTQAEEHLLEAIEELTEHLTEIGALRKWIEDGRPALSGWIRSVVDKSEPGEINLARATYLIFLRGNPMPAVVLSGDRTPITAPPVAKKKVRPVAVEPVRSEGLAGEPSAPTPPADPCSDLKSENPPPPDSPAGEDKILTVFEL
jgi:hypothetical protein